MSAHDLEIISPKRDKTSSTGWAGFFPYYAGYPEKFATTLLNSADLSADSVILDPWNGSGTTTHAAATLGFGSIGIDINPVMVIVARARMLPSSESDSLQALAKTVLKAATSANAGKETSLDLWFSQRSARFIRKIESSIRQHMVGQLTLTPRGARLRHLSAIAAANYVALFSAVRNIASSCIGSNPTWTKIPEKKVRSSPAKIEEAYLNEIDRMAASLEASQYRCGNASEIRLGDASKPMVSDNRADLILTSPPYCTRIDYAAATRIELAILEPILGPSAWNLRRELMGSVLTPREPLSIQKSWGRTTQEFLEKVASHPSRASGGYYLNTHIDYFHKLHSSLSRCGKALKPRGKAVFVVQNSFYKEIENPLNRILTEMCENMDLTLLREEIFESGRTMAHINSQSRKYVKTRKSQEFVVVVESTKSD